jgi:hypothetical protein
VSDDLHDLRCPIDSRRLFGRVRGAQIVAGNLIEIACDDCRKTARRNGQVDVSLVLHRFNVLGEHIESETVTSPGPTRMPPRRSL